VLQETLRKSRGRFREEGFTLTEILLAILVVGILTAIVVPMYLNAKAESDSATIKTALQSSAILIEQEAIDNNGLYPTYFPNELKNNPKMAPFVYSYSDSRTNFCIQAPSPVGKLFVSANNKEVSSTPCTEDNIADGGNTPWEIPTITTPTAPGVVNTWASTSPNSVSAITINPATCTLQPADQAEWSPKTTVQYRVQVTNNSRGGEFYNTAWDSSRNITSNLPREWLPNETVTYSAQARCLITNGIDYSYTSPLSAKTTKNIATFVVTPAQFTATAAAWTSNINFRTTASWEDAYCPSGVKQSLLSIVDVKTGSSVPNSTVWSAWRTDYIRDSNTWSSGGTTRFTHTVGCLLSNGQTIKSAPVVQNVVTPLRPPVAPTGLNSNTAQGSTLVVPNNVLWNAVTCVAGTPQYNLQQFAPDGTKSSGWITGINQFQEHLAGTRYDWRVQAKCVEGTVSSIASEFSDVYSYTAQYSRASAPLSAPVPDSTAPVRINSAMKFTFNSNTCPTGTTTTTYRLYVNGQLAGSNTNNFVNTSVSNVAGNYSYTYRLICDIDGFTTTESLDSPATIVSVINKPNPPTNFTNSRIYILNATFTFTGVNEAAKYELLYNGQTNTFNQVNSNRNYIVNAIGTVRNTTFVNASKLFQPPLEAEPTAQIRSVDIWGNTSDWVTISVDTPRQRLFSKYSNGFLPNSGGQASSSNTRSGNSLVAADGENWAVLQGDRNFVRYTRQVVAQNATNRTIGFTADHMVFNQSGAFAFYEQSNGWVLRQVVTENNDMLAMENAGSGGQIKIYVWNGSGYTLRSIW
jgi:prepilin-type N-terminal cleavage/methylation domain-containing protein